LQQVEQEYVSEVWRVNFQRKCSGVHLIIDVTAIGNFQSYYNNQCVSASPGTDFFNSGRIIDACQ